MNENKSFELTAEDIMLIFQNCDINELLLPLQKNPQKYKPYIKFPGRIEKRNTNAVKGVPKVAYDLYINFDKEYISIFNKELECIKRNTVKVLSDMIGNIVDLSVFTRINTKEFEQLFEDILNKNKKFDIDYFLLKVKILGYALSDGDVIMVKHRWDILDAIHKVKIEEKEYYDKLLDVELNNAKRNYDENITVCIKEKEELIKKINKVERENELSFNQFKDAQKEKEEKLSEIIETQNTLYKKKEEEILSLNLKIINLISSKEEISERLKNAITETQKLKKDIMEKKNLLYDDIELEWMEKNEEKQRELKEIQFNISKEIETQKSLSDSIQILQEKINYYNNELENYLNNIDIRLIEQRVQNLLKGWTNNNIKKGNKAVSGVPLYIKNEDVISDILICNEYKLFQETAEANLKIIGVRKNTERLLLEFVSAFMSDLYPVICGYRSLEIAQAVISAWYGETSKIIEIPTGFQDSLLLEDIIQDSTSNCVILGNVIGNMNESVLLPLLRNKSTMKKRLVILCEDVKDLEYLPKSYYNYLYFVQYEVTEACCDGVFSFIFSNNNIINSHKMNYKANEKGYMIVRALLKNTGISSSYILTRGRFCCILLENNLTVRDIVDIVIKEVNIFCNENDIVIIKQNLQEYKILEYVEEV